MSAVVSKPENPYGGAVCAHDGQCYVVTCPRCGALYIHTPHKEAAQKAADGHKCRVSKKSKRSA